MVRSVETLCELCHQQDGQQVPDEVALLRRVAHVPGVLRLVDYFRRPDGYVLVLDRPDRSEDLFDYITRRGALDDAEARSVFRRVVETLCQVLVMRAFRRLFVHTAHRITIVYTTIV